MSDSDKISIVNIVINTVIAIIGWAIFIWATKRTIQATLLVASPVDRPIRERELIGIERRALKRMRAIQVCTVIIAMLEPFNFFYSPLRLVLGYDTVSVVLCVVATVSMFAAAVAVQFEIRRIKSGEYLKDIMRARHARKHPKQSK